MRRNIIPSMRMPLFFKLCFGFVAAVAICGIAFYAYAGYMLVQAGPEGIGRAIGAAVHGFESGVQK